MDIYCTCTGPICCEDGESEKVVTRDCGSCNHLSMDAPELNDPEKFDVFFERIFGDDSNEGFGANDVYNILMKAFKSGSIKIIN